jgi:hypothetical protein
MGCGPFLAEHPVKPWRYQSRIFPRDPDSGVKATAILDRTRGFTRDSRCGLVTGSCL